MNIRSKFFLVILFFLLLKIIPDLTNAWPLYYPRVIVGGSAGVLRNSLDNFSKYYDSRWDLYYSGNINIRVYRTTFATVQYAYFQKASQSDTSSGACISSRTISIPRISVLRIHACLVTPYGFFAPEFVNQSSRS